MTIAYYNETDIYAAQWLRNLIAAGHIAPGIVDERDIRDVTPSQLANFTQCHFFAGIGIWSHALRRAGWPDDRQIWTGSCPCQPFSAAGRGAGFADERHLWPHWYHLIGECRPSVVVGEQVASKDGLGWLDLVSADMEAAAYAFGASDLCAAGVTVEWQESQPGQWLDRAVRDCGDPIVAGMLRDFADWAGAGNIGDGGKHIRQRLYFVGLADVERDGRGARWNGDHGWHVGPQLDPNVSHDGVEYPDVADAAEECARDDAQHEQRAADGRRAIVAAGSGTGSGDSDGHRGGRRDALDATDQVAGMARPDAVDGGRSPADWLYGRDGKWRAVEPGSFPLAHAVAARVGRLRAYGNGLDAETATNFCEVVKEIVG